jgi:DNA-binding Lrp family transcriptional regulator
VDIDKTMEAAIDKLRDAVSDGKLPRGVRDLLESKLSADEFETAADEVRQSAEELRERMEELEGQAEEIEARADAIAAVGEAIGEALEAVEGWEEAEGRDDKADARETVLDALGTVTEAFDEIVDEVGEVGGIDADGYDILSPEEKAWAVVAERIAHKTVADFLWGVRADVNARLPEGEGIPHRATLEAEVHSIILDHEYKGGEPVEGE